MPRTDIECLGKLLLGRHACVYVPTYEEEHALEVVRTAAAEQRRHLFVWSVTRGVVDGTLADEPPVSDTANPAGAMTHLAMHAAGADSVVVMLDLAGHLKEERVLRCLRELIGRMERTGQHSC